MIRSLAILAALAGAAHAETVTVVGKPELAEQLARVPLLVVRPLDPGREPAELAHAIETFSEGDCASAIVQIEDVARGLDLADIAAVRGRVLLWHAAILQRCDQLDRANRVLDALVGEQPDIRVDLGELWPSFAELVDAARARNPRRSRDLREVAGAVRKRTGATTIVIADADTIVIDRRGTQRTATFESTDAAAAWVASTLAPPHERTLSIGAAIIPAAGRETTLDHEKLGRFGSGLAAHAALDRGVWRAELATHAVRYAAPEGEMAGGWDVGGVLRIGTGLHLGDRVAVVAHGLVAASTDRGGPHDMDRLGFGLGGALQWRATAKLSTTLAIDWLPVAVAAVDGMDHADPNMSVLLGLGLGWQWSRRWSFDLAATMDQHDTDLRRGDTTLHQSDMTMRFSFGAQHRY